MHYSILLVGQKYEKENSNNRSAVKIIQEVYKGIFSCEEWFCSHLVGFAVALIAFYF